MPSTYGLVRMRAFSACSVLLVLVAGIAAANAKSLDYDKLGFDKKEAAALKSLGVTSVEDMTYLLPADLEKLSDMNTVAMRKLQTKVRGAASVHMIGTTDITGICAEMAANRHDRAVQVAGAKALVDKILQYRHSTYRIEQIAKAPDGAVFALVRAMEIHFESADVVEATVHGLHLLAFNDNTKSRIGQSGGVDAVIMALTKHGDKPQLMQYALRLLSKVVFNENIKKSLATEANLETILNSIVLHNMEPSYLDEACMALWSITTPAQYCLHMAAQRGMKDVVNAIIAVGGIDAVRTVEPESERTALHVAALHGQREIVEILIKAGDAQFVEAMDKEFRATAFHMAAATGKKDVVATLVEKGGEHLATVMEGHTGKTPFLVAIERGEVAVCDYLVTRLGKDIMAAVDAVGNNAMHLAGGGGMAEGVKFLLGYTADFGVLWGGLNGNRVSAAMLANVNNHPVVGRIIEDALKDVHAK